MKKQIVHEHERCISSTFRNGIKFPARISGLNLEVPQEANDEPASIPTQTLPQHA